MVRTNITALSLLLFSLTLGCAAVPDQGAEAACRSIFEAWVEKAASCGFGAETPDMEETCRLAYSYSDEKLNDKCLPWISGAECGALNNAAFQAHCGEALYFRTW